MSKQITKLALGMLISLFALSANAAFVKVYDTDNSLHNLADAKNVIDSAAAPDLMLESNHIWFSDSGRDFPYDPAGMPFPGGFGDTFVMEIKGLIDTDNYSHIYVGHDDGVHVSIDHSMVYEYDGTTAYNYTNGGFYLGSAAGMQSIHIVYFENHGEADLFLWGYRRNNHTKERLNLYSVPEPAVLSLFGIGLLGLGVAGRRRRTQ